MFNVTSRTVTTKVIDLSLDEELAIKLAAAIDEYHSRRDILPSFANQKLQAISSAIKKITAT
jgi:hypothetical protein